MLLSLRFINNLPSSDNLIKGGASKTYTVNAILFDNDYYLTKYPNLVSNDKYKKNYFLHYLDIGRNDNPKPDTTSLSSTVGAFTYIFKWYANGELLPSSYYTTDGTNGSSTITIPNEFKSSKEFKVEVSAQFFKEADYNTLYGTSDDLSAFDNDKYTHYRLIGFNNSNYPSIIINNQQNKEDWRKQLGSDASVSQVSNILKINYIENYFNSKYFYNRDNSIDDQYNYIPNFNLNFDSKYYLDKYRELINEWQTKAYQHYVDYGSKKNQLKSPSPYSYNVYLPIYGTSVKYSSRLNFLETIDNTIKVIPNSENNLIIKYNLKFLLDDYSSGNLLKTIEIAAAHKPLTFIDPSNFYTEIVGLVEDYSINKTSSSLNEINIILSSYFKVPSFNWKSSKIIDKVALYAISNPTTDQITYKNISAFPAVEQSDKDNINYNSYYPSFGSPHSKNRRYKKYDFVFILNKDIPGLDNFWFAKKDIDAGVNFSENNWTKDFFHETKYPFALSNKFDIKQLEYKNSFIQNVKHKNNINTIKSFEIKFENITDLQAKSILFFLEKKSGFRKFKYDFPIFFKKEKVFICPSWEHVMNFKDSHNITATFIEDPSALELNRFISIPTINEDDLNYLNFLNSNQDFIVYGYSSDFIKWNIPIIGNFQVNYKWSTNAVTKIDASLDSSYKLSIGPNITKDQAGEYWLTASNDAGSTETVKKKIIVKYKPEISKNITPLGDVSSFSNPQKNYITFRIETNYVDKLGLTTFAFFEKRQNDNLTINNNVETQLTADKKTQFAEIKLTVTDSSYFNKQYYYQLLNKNTSITEPSSIVISEIIPIPYNFTQYIITQPIGKKTFEIMDASYAIVAQAWGKYPITATLTKKSANNTLKDTIIDTKVLTGLSSSLDYTYSFTNIKATTIGAYYISFSDSLNKVIKSNDFDIFISTPFKFISQPTSVTQNSGTNITFLYQFYIANSISNKLFDTANLVLYKNGESYATETITNPSENILSYSRSFTNISTNTLGLYQLIVTLYPSTNGQNLYGSSPISFKSNKISINIPNVGPSIIDHPDSQSLIIGEKLTLSVAALGSNLTYQWYYRSTSSNTWFIITGETDNVYIINSVTLNNIGSYFVKVTNSIGYADSNIANLSVFLAPRIKNENGATAETFTSSTPIYLDSLYSVDEIFYGNDLVIKWYKKSKIAPYQLTEINNTPNTLINTYTVNTGPNLKRSILTIANDSIVDPINNYIIAEASNRAGIAKKTFIFDKVFYPITIAGIYDSKSILLPIARNAQDNYAIVNFSPETITYFNINDDLELFGERSTIALRATKGISYITLKSFAWSRTANIYGNIRTTPILKSIKWYNMFYDNIPAYDGKEEINLRTSELGLFYAIHAEYTYEYPLTYNNNQSGTITLETPSIIIKTIGEPTVKTNAYFSSSNASIKSPNIIYGSTNIKLNATFLSPYSYYISYKISYKINSTQKNFTDIYTSNKIYIPDNDKNISYIFNSFNYANGSVFRITFFAQDGISTAFSEVVATVYSELNDIKNTYSENSNPYFYLPLYDGQVYKHSYKVSPITSNAITSYKYKWFLKKWSDSSYVNETSVLDNNNSCTIDLTIKNLSSAGLYRNLYCYEVYNYPYSTTTLSSSIPLEVCSFSPLQISQKCFFIYGSSVSSMGAANNNLCQLTFKFCFNAAGFPFNMYLFAGPISYINGTRTDTKASLATNPVPSINMCCWKYKCVKLICSNLNPKCSNYFTESQVFSYYCVEFNYSIPVDAFAGYTNSNNSSSFGYYECDGFHIRLMSQRMYSIVLTTTSAITHPTYKAPIPLVTMPFSPYDWSLYKPNYKPFFGIQPYGTNLPYGDGRTWTNQSIAIQAENDYGFGKNYISYPDPLA